MIPIKNYDGKYSSLYICYNKERRNMDIRFGLALKIILVVLYATSVVCLLLGMLLPSNLMMTIGYIALMIASITGLVFLIKFAISKRCSRK